MFDNGRIRSKDIIRKKDILIGNLNRKITELEFDVLTKNLEIERLNRLLCKQKVVEPKRYKWSWKLNKAVRL